MTITTDKNTRQEPIRPITEPKLVKPHVFDYLCSSCPHQVRLGDSWRCHRYPPTTTNGLDELRPAALLPCGEHPDFIYDLASYMQKSRAQDELDEAQLRLNAQLAAKQQRAEQLAERDYWNKRLEQPEQPKTPPASTHNRKETPAKRRSGPASKSVGKI